MLAARMFGPPRASLLLTTSLVAIAASVVVFGCADGDPHRVDAGSSRRDASTLDSSIDEFPDAARAAGDAAEPLGDAFVLPDGASAEGDGGATAPTDSGMLSEVPDARVVASCGGRGGALCLRGQFCDFPPSAMCGRAGGAGVCAAIPAVCRSEDAPVCGCDGVTYASPCEAARASVSIESVGACPIRCNPDLALCDSLPPLCRTGSVPSVEGGCWGACVPLGSCTCSSSADCPGDATCSSRTGRCLSLVVIPDPEF